MARMPGAVWRPIPIASTRPRRSKGRGVCLHVAVSESASLFGYFSTASVDSHFYVTKTGVVEQYVDSDLVAYANGAGNATLISVETQGGVTNVEGEPWTPAQVTALGAICRWARDSEGVPLQAMPNSLSTSRGIGFHRLGVDPYRVSGGELWSSSYGKTCPGAAKVAQIPQVITAAKGGAITGDDDMSYSQWPKADRDFLLNDIRDSVLIPVIQQWFGAIYNAATHHGADEDNHIGHAISGHKYAKEARDILAAGGGTSAGSVLAALSDADVARIAKAVADETARRQVS